MDMKNYVVHYVSKHNQVILVMYVFVEFLKIN